MKGTSMRKAVIIVVIAALTCAAAVWYTRSHTPPQLDGPSTNTGTSPSELLSQTTIEPLNTPQSAKPTAGARDMMSAQQPSGVLDESLAREVDAAVNRSLDWLAAKQRDDGSWSNNKFPALTGLALQAFVGSNHPKHSGVVAKAVKFILSCARDDGGIYVHVEGRKGGGLSNYNTAICMTALHATRSPAVRTAVLNARKFVADSQHFGGDVYDGGFGYDKKTQRTYADGLNTFYSARAMALTADAEESRPKDHGRVDIDWDRTLKFLASLQNTSADGEDQAGGFFYMPGQSKAGSVTNAAGTVVFRSYGSMTYVGMLALVYANVARDDPRVISAFHWSARHWTLEENPGMGQQGVYFFYNVLSKSLDAYRSDLIPRGGGKFVDWRKELAKKLVSTQRIDPTDGAGYWLNDAGRFWENDPILATAYSIMALQTTL